jgi:hypothetical protein
MVKRGAGTTTKTIAIALSALALPAALAAGEAKKPKAPRLDLKLSNATVFSYTSVAPMAQLVGGDDLEEFYCPAVEWDWGDGTRSRHESDCPPFEPGFAIDRHYAERHEYRQAGTYLIRVTLSRVDRPVAISTTLLTVVPGVRRAGFEE